MRLAMSVINQGSKSERRHLSQGTGRRIRRSSKSRESIESGGVSSRRKYLRDRAFIKTRIHDDETIQELTEDLEM
jgi:hypothetical protein